MFKCKVKALLWVQCLAQWYYYDAYPDSASSPCVNNLDAQSLIILLKMFINQSNFMMHILRISSSHSVTCTGYRPELQEEF